MYDQRRHKRERAEREKLTRRKAEAVGSGGCMLGWGQLLLRAGLCGALTAELRLMGRGHEKRPKCSSWVQQVLPFALLPARDGACKAPEETGLSLWSYGPSPIPHPYGMRSQGCAHGTVLLGGGIEAGAAFCAAALPSCCLGKHRAQQWVIPVVLKAPAVRNALEMGLQVAPTGRDVHNSWG